MSFRALTFLVMLAGCNPVPLASAEHDGDPAIRVRTASVEPLPSHRDVELHGVTRSRDRGEIGFTVGGRLAERLVGLGERVEAGQVLARLDRAPYLHAHRASTGQVGALEVRLAQLGRDRARLEALGDTRSVSPAELERIRSEEDGVVASLAALRASASESARQLDEAVLRAPFAGVVTFVGAEPGETVAAGAPIVALSGRGVEVELQVPERVWTGLRPGDAATIELPALSRTVDGQVRSVSGAATGTGLFPVLVDLPDVAPGLTARVTLRLPLEPGLAVPVSALVDPVGSGAAVYRIGDGTAERVAVQPGALLGDTVGVTGALQPGDEIVVAGHARLLDGDRVEVVR